VSILQLFFARLPARS